MKKIIKWIFYIFIALMVIGFIVGKDKKQTAAETTTEQSTSSVIKDKPVPAAPQQMVLSTTATKLFNAYEENEVAADEQMKGNLIEVSGVVQSIEKDFTDSIIIQLKTSNEFMPASMTMEDSEKSTALTLRKGKKVTITCEKMARVMGSPFGRSCVFNK